MRTLHLAALCVFMFFVFITNNNQSYGQAALLQRDEYGGVILPDHNFGESECFRIEKLKDRYFFVTPAGNAFYSIGINQVHPYFGDYRDTTYDQPPENNGYDTDGDGKGNMDAWVTVHIPQILGWGFNTLGYSSSGDGDNGYGSQKDVINNMLTLQQKIPFTYTLYFVNPHAINRTDFPDVWSSEFEDHCDSEIVDSDVWSYVNGEHSDYLIGYFLSNELDIDLAEHNRTPDQGTGWSFEGYPDDLEHMHWRHRWVFHLLLRDEMDGSPAFTEFESMASSRYESIDLFIDTYDVQDPAFDSWEDITPEIIRHGIEHALIDPGPGPDDRHSKIKKDFEEYNALLAAKYYEVAVGAIRRMEGYDRPHHLILGSRFGSGVQRKVVEKVSEFTDVHSLNKYPLEDDFHAVPLWCGYIFFWEGLINWNPVLHTEFSWLKAGENLQCDSNGDIENYPTVDQQFQRGVRYKSHVFSHKQVDNYDLPEVEVPFIVGFAWYDYIDTCDHYTDEGVHVKSNFGLIDIYDNPYQYTVELIDHANDVVLYEFKEQIEDLLNEE